MELPTQLKKHRELKGLSQEDVVNQIFVSRYTISNWETGKTYPDVQSLLLLRNLFGVFVDELLKGDVAVMRDVISKDAVRVRELTIGEIALLLCGVACLPGFGIVWKDASFIPEISCGAVAGIVSFVIFWIGAMFCAFRIKKIKKEHNLVSYKEINDFVEGKEPEEGSIKDSNSFSRKHPKASNAMKACIGAVIGLLSGFIVSKLVIFFA